MRSARRRREQPSVSPGPGTPFTERSFQVGVLLMIAGVAYSMWILEFVLPTGLSPVQSFVSEHYVVTQPYHALFRCADVVAGVVYMIVASRLTGLLSYGLAGSAVVVGLGVFGLTTVTDALFVQVLLVILVISGLGCLTFYEIGWVGIPQRIELVVIAAGTFGAAVRSLPMHHPFSRFLHARK